MSFDLNFIGILIGAIMASSVPLILAASGELITERSGVLNLGVEGMMIIGAISGFALMVITDNLFLAVIGSMLSGLIISIIFGCAYTIASHKPCCYRTCINNFWYRDVSNDRKEFCWNTRQRISLIIC